jgi:spermidine/putrescine transport system permease protein
VRSKTPAIPYLFWIGIFVAVPLILVVIFAFTTKNGNVTLINFYNIRDYAPVFGRSFFLSFISTAICLVIGYPTALFLSREKNKVQGILIMLAILPMWMNFLLRTYSWLTLLENNGLINRFLGLFGIGPFQMINTQGAVVVGMVYNFLPFMILPIYTVLSKIDENLVAAAHDLGANPSQTFQKVIFPMSVPGVISGITMVFVPGVSTFVISKMLGGGANMLVGDLIEMQFLGNAYNPYLGSAISLVIMVLILICMYVMRRYDKEWEGGALI